MERRGYAVSLSGHTPVLRDLAHGDAAAIKHWSFNVVGGARCQFRRWMTTKLGRMHEGSKLITAEGVFMIQGMIYTNTPDVPGREIEEILGVITGNVVQSKHVGRDIMAGLKTIVGGEIESYTAMLTEARHTAIARLVEEANKLDADAVVNLRFATSSIMSGSAEILAYGTAVKLKPN